MISGQKFHDLMEQTVNDPKGGGVAGYDRAVRQWLGLCEGPGGLYVDHKAREVSPLEVSFGELWHSFRPRGFNDSEMALAMHAAQEKSRGQRLLGLAEGEGHVVLPSSFVNISAFSATVAGLVDALVLEGYQTAAFVGDQIFSADPQSRMNGGNVIGVMNDGQAGDNLLNGEPYPAVGLKETKIAIPENQRRGNAIQLTELDFIYDLTGKIRDATVGAGTAVKRLKEVAEAKVFLGLTNTYSRDGNSGNTYQKVAGFVPVDYVNSVGSKPLAGFADVDVARLTLMANRDPGTGWEISVPKPVQVAVMPQRSLNLMTIARATEVETRTVDQTKIFRAANPLYSIDQVELPELYYNLLVASGVSTTNAAERWYAGDFRKAFAYRTIIPFESREAPLSSDDVRRDVVLIRVAREIGVPYVREPRYVFCGTNEA